MHIHRKHLLISHQKRQFVVPALENFENGHLVFSIFLKKTNKKTTESVIFRPFSKYIVMALIICLWNEDEVSPTPSFSCFFLE